MSEKEKGEILETIKSLSPEDKNFVLGYMAGRTADKQEEKPANVSTEGK